MPTGSEMVPCLLGMQRYIYVINTHNGEQRERGWRERNKLNEYSVESVNIFNCYFD